ncbi:hypothetical protein LZ554_009085 [Drepanopeziza brunnea f. sp. 'monogermtubi']|nr:hypothetical protein LZ554_009085 [Drepanopeziza brunnea f. sp. 'monogermtubi']
MTKASSRRKQKIVSPKIGSSLGTLISVCKKSLIQPPAPYKTEYMVSIHIPTADVHPRRRYSTHAASRELKDSVGTVSASGREPLRQQHRSIAPPPRIDFNWDSDRVCWMSTMKSRLNMDGVTIEFQEYLASKNLRPAGNQHTRPALCWDTSPGRGSRPVCQIQEIKLGLYSQPGIPEPSSIGVSLMRCVVSRTVKNSTKEVAAEEQLDEEGSGTQVADSEASVSASASAADPLITEDGEA